MAEYLLRAPDATMDLWRKAAEQEGLSLAEWLRLAASVRAGGVEDLNYTAIPISTKKTFKPDPK